MQSETPKKKVDYMEPTPAQYFWRTQRECWKRMVGPTIMYLFMGLILVAVQAIPIAALKIVLGVLIILLGAFFNGHLMYQCGKKHYDNSLTGSFHRRNRAYGVMSGESHHIEREYSPWKGFYIGFLVGVPVILLSVLAHFFYDVVTIVFIILAGWAITPITWFGAIEGGGLKADVLWSMMMIILPIVVSGVFYIVGAIKEKKKKQQESERIEKLQNKGKKNK